MSALKFTLIGVAIVGILCTAAYFIGQSEFPTAAMPFIYGAIGLAALSTIISFYILNRSLKVRIRAFSQSVMGSMMVKMFIGIISITLVALKFKDVTLHYVLTYFLCYFIFTAFEVVILMSNLRAEKSEEKRNENEKSAV